MLLSFPFKENLVEEVYTVENENLPSVNEVVAPEEDKLPSIEVQAPKEEASPSVDDVLAHEKCRFALCG